MKKKWKIVLCIALAAVVLGGSLTVWRLCFPPDTNPEAPFRDLPNWQKNNIRKAVEEALSEKDYHGHWFGEPVPEDNSWHINTWDFYALRYYGTFSGYHIVFVPIQSTHRTDTTLEIGETIFSYADTFRLFAYRNGTLISLEEAYNRGLIDDAQIKQIGQCYERYKYVVYFRYVWESLYAKDRAGLYWLLAGCILLAVAGAGFVIFRVRIQCGLSKLIADAGIGMEGCRKKKWKTVLCIVLAAVVLCGSLTAWLLTRTPPDTDPNAPFEDLPRRTKEKIRVAVKEFWDYRGDNSFDDMWWYGEVTAEMAATMPSTDVNYNLQYYGTFNGYHIVCFQYDPCVLMRTSVTIAGYNFSVRSSELWLFAYKDGVAVPLSMAYWAGEFSDEQIGKIHQCWERYGREVYVLRDTNKWY